LSSFAPREKKHKDGSKLRKKKQKRRLGPPKGHYFSIHPLFAITRRHQTKISNKVRRARDYSQEH
jgi:hypothetical protein